MMHARPASGGASGQVPGWAAFALLVAGTLWLALDGRQYWHDARLIYACSEFSSRELLAGVFNPHQAWGPVDEASSAGFYEAKLLHLGLLCGAWSLLPRSPMGFKTLVGLSALWMGLAVLAGYWTFRQLFGRGPRAALGAACILLSPLTPYLAGKLLSEVTSLLFATLAVGMLAGAMRPAGSRAVTHGALGGLFLAVAALARIDALIGPTAFLLASVVAGGTTRRQAIRAAAIALPVAAVAYTAAAGVAGVRLSDLQGYFDAFVAAPNRPLAMSILGVLTAGGLVLPLAAVGLFSRDRVAVRVLGFWMLATWVPLIAITQAFMVEPRYLTAGLLPLAGLGALGLELLAERVPAVLRSRAAVIAAILAGLGLNALAVPLMPYEVDRPAILSAVRQIERADPDARILVPWAYSDFNFLRAVVPDADIYCVYLPEPVDPRYETAWRERYRNWYGERYLTDPGGLRELLRDGPVYYLGWDIYPPLQNARTIAQAIGLRSVSEHLAAVARGKLANHLEESWIWRAGGLLKLERLGRVGQYQYFRVRLRNPRGAAPARPAGEG